MSTSKTGYRHWEGGGRGERESRLSLFVRLSNILENERRRGALMSLVVAAVSRARLGEATSVLGAPDLLRRLFELSARIYVSAVVRVLIFRGMIAAECMCGKHAAC